MASALLKKPVKITERNLCYFGAFIYALELVDEKARDRGVWQEVRNEQGRIVYILPEIPYHVLCDVVRKIGDRCWLSNHPGTAAKINGPPQ